MKTIKPTKSPLSSPPELSRPFSSFSKNTGQQAYDQTGPDSDGDDFADLAFDEKELSQKVASFRLQGLKKNTIYRPEDISKLSLRGKGQPSQPSSPRRSTSGNSLFPDRPRLSSSGSFGSLSSRSPSRSSSFRFASPEEVEQIKATQEELSKYAEVEDEGYDDVFGHTEADNVDKKREPVNSSFIFIG